MKFNIGDAVIVPNGRIGIITGRDIDGYMVLTRNGSNTIEKWFIENDIRELILPNDWFSSVETIPETTKPEGLLSKAVASAARGFKVGDKVLIQMYSSQEQKNFNTGVILNVEQSDTILRYRVNVNDGCGHSDIGWYPPGMIFKYSDIFRHEYECKFPDEVKNPIKTKPGVVKKSHEEDTLTPKQGAQLKAAAFYQRLYFWGMVIGFVGGGWLGPYVKNAVWHFGQFLVSLK